MTTIKHLVERGQPLFGDNETIGSVRNGNFLGSLELISKFDPVIVDHLPWHVCHASKILLNMMEILFLDYVNNIYEKEIKLK